MARHFQQPVVVVLALSLLRLPKLPDNSHTGPLRAIHRRDLAPSPPPLSLPAAVSPTPPAPSDTKWGARMSPSGWPPSTPVCSAHKSTAPPRPRKPLQPSMVLLLPVAMSSAGITPRAASTGSSPPLPPPVSPVSPAPGPSSPPVAPPPTSTLTVSPPPQQLWSATFHTSVG